MVNPQANGYKVAAFDVKAGDLMWAKVTASGHNFVMTIADLTTQQQTVVKATVKSASKLQGQWMIQTPEAGCPKKCVPDALVHFKSVSFTNCQLTIAGTLGLLNHWPREAWAMGKGAVRKTTISTIVHGNSFVVTWRHK
jgi:hypothetical protein